MADKNDDEEMVKQWLLDIEDNPASDNDDPEEDFNTFSDQNFDELGEEEKERRDYEENYDRNEC